MISKATLAASKAAEALDNEMSSIHEAVKKIDPEDFIIENRDSYEEEISLNRLKSGDNMRFAFVYRQGCEQKLVDFYDYLQERGHIIDYINPEYVIVLGGDGTILRAAGIS